MRVEHAGVLWADEARGMGAPLCIFVPSLSLPGLKAQLNNTVKRVLKRGANPPN